MLLVAILLTVSANKVQSQNGSWISVSPPGSLGAVLLGADRAGNPLTAMDFYYYEEQRSLFRFSDNIWTSLRLDGSVLTTVAVDSTGGIFVGTTEGIIRSADDGVTWVPIGPLAQSVRSIAFDPAGFIFAATDSGVYRTSDGGGEWVKTPFWAWHVTGVVINQGGDVFASTESYGEGFVFRSTDKGATWQLKNNGIPGTAKDVIALLVDRHGTLFAGTFEKLLFRSSDNGDSWELCPLAWYYHLVYDSANDVLYADSPEGIVRSQTHGESWQLLAGTAGHYNSLLVTPTGVLYGSSGLIFRYATDHWDTLASNGLPPPVVRAVTGLVSGEVVISTDRGIARSTNSGVSWLNVAGLDDAAPATQLVARKTGDLFRVKSAGYITMTLSVDRSSDGGASWSVVFETTGYDYGYGGPALLLAVGPQEDIFVGGPSGVMRSTDSGSSWDSTGLKDFVYAIAAHPNGSLFAATSSDVFVSSDRGDTWTASGLDISIVCLAVDSAGILCAGSDFAAFRSTNLGQVWLQTFLRGYAVAGLIGDADGSFRASVTGEGILGSSDHGVSWEPMNDGLPDLSVACLGLDWSGALYAGMSSHGLYRFMRSPNSVSSEIAGTPRSFSLSQNYPNPFNPITVIRYQVPIAGDVKLVVYDLLGREVVVLVDERRVRGSYEVKFDATGLASGVYFYRLQAGSYVNTKKLLLLR
jgi:photosystem II stability/assembly factor-like uncharacterized protein